MVFLSLRFGHCHYVSRLTVLEEAAKTNNKKLAQGMSDLNKTMAAAKDDAAKAACCKFSRPIFCALGVRFAKTVKGS